MEENLQRLCVGCHDDEVGDASVQSLGGLVSALLELLVVASLLDQLKDLHGEFGVREGVCLFNLLSFFIF